MSGPRPKILMRWKIKYGRRRERPMMSKRFWGWSAISWCWNPERVRKWKTKVRKSPEILWKKLIQSLSPPKRSPGMKIWQKSARLALESCAKIFPEQIHQHQQNCRFGGPWAPCLSQRLRVLERSPFSSERWQKPLIQEILRYPAWLGVSARTLSSTASGPFRKVHLFCKISARN